MKKIIRLIKTAGSEETYSAEMDYNNTIMTIGFIILIVIITIYICSVSLYHLNGNPICYNLDYKSEEKFSSIITHNDMGNRGDMGNQIFQIACLMGAAKTSNSKIILPTRIKNMPISELFDLSKFEYDDINIDRHFYEYKNFENLIIPPNNLTYNIRGYRQSYKYFDQYKSLIKETFTPQEKLLATIRASLPEKYIGLHIRKGDYIKTIHNIPVFREFKICKMEYYKLAIQRLRKSHPDNPIVVCTDSPSFVLPFLSQLDSNISLAPVFDKISPKLSDFCVLYLANCLIISNSTYSWWAAYLNSSQHVIAPTPWWDPAGFVGSALAFDNSELHYPSWTLLDSDTGHLVRHPNSTIGNRSDNEQHTLSIYSLIRGLVI